MEKLPNGIINKFIIGTVTCILSLTAWLLYDNFIRLRNTLDNVQKSLGILEKRFETIYSETLRNQAINEKLSDITRETGERLTRLETQIEYLHNTILNLNSPTTNSSKR